MTVADEPSPAGLIGFKAQPLALLDDVEPCVIDRKPRIGGMAEMAWGGGVAGFFRLRRLVGRGLSFNKAESAIDERSCNAAIAISG